MVSEPSNTNSYPGQVGAHRIISAKPIENYPLAQNERPERVSGPSFPHHAGRARSAILFGENCPQAAPRSIAWTASIIFCALSSMSITMRSTRVTK